MCFFAKILRNFVKISQKFREKPREESARIWNDNKSSGVGKFHLFYGGNKQELTVISNSTRMVN